MMSDIDIVNFADNNIPYMSAENISPVTSLESTSCRIFKLLRQGKTVINVMFCEASCYKRRISSNLQILFIFAEVIIPGFAAKLKGLAHLYASFECPPLPCPDTLIMGYPVSCFCRICI